jgi:hypothetical protein
MMDEVRFIETESNRKSNSQGKDPMNEKLEQLLKVLFSFSLGQLAVSITLTAAIASGVWWFARWTSDTEVKSAELKGQLELSQALAQNSELRRQQEHSSAVALSLVSPNAGLPSLEVAPPDKTSMADFVKLRAKFQAGNADKTTLQRPDFYKPSAGHRFDWSGFVREVYPEEPFATVVLSFDDPPTLVQPTLCYFDSKTFNTILQQLKKGQKISVAGVMNKSGDLANCKILDDHPPHFDLNKLLGLGGGRHTIEYSVKRPEPPQPPPRPHPGRP